DVLLLRHVVGLDNAQADALVVLHADHVRRDAHRRLQRPQDRGHRAAVERDALRIGAVRVTERLRLVVVEPGQTADRTLAESLGRAGGVRLEHHAVAGDRLDSLRREDAVALDHRQLVAAQDAPGRPERAVTRARVVARPLDLATATGGVGRGDELLREAL